MGEVRLQGAAILRKTSKISDEILPRDMENTSKYPCV